MECKRRRYGNGFMSTFRASFANTARASSSTRSGADGRTGNAPCYPHRFCRRTHAHHAEIHAHGPSSRLPLPAPQQQIPSLPCIHQGCTPHARSTPPMRLCVTTPINPLRYALRRWGQTDIRPRHLRAQEQSGKTLTIRKECFPGLKARQMDSGGDCDSF